MKGVGVVKSGHGRCCDDSSSYTPSPSTKNEPRPQSIVIHARHRVRRGAGLDVFDLPDLGILDLLDTMPDPPPTPRYPAPVCHDPRPRTGRDLHRSMLVHRDRRIGPRPTAPGAEPARCGGCTSERVDIRRILGRVAAGLLDRVLGAWACLRIILVDGRRVIAVDGKTLRGAPEVASHVTHLPRSTNDAGVVVGQREVGATNETEVAPREWTPDFMRRLTA